MLGVRPDLGHGDLVRAEGAFHRLPIDHLGSGPPFRRPQDDHRPPRPGGIPAIPSRPLDVLDLLDHSVEDLGHALVHNQGIVAFDKIRMVPVPLEECAQLCLGDPRQQGRVRDLVPVQVEDWEHRAIADRVEKLVRVPARRQRAGLGLAVPDDATDEEIGGVERRAVGMGQRIPQLAAFVDGPRGLGGHVAGDSAGERELPEQLPQPFGIPGDARIDLAVGPLEVGVGHDARAPVPGADDVDGVQVPVPDHAVQVDVEEVQAGGRAPVS
jgi:hypothetical protein